MISVNDDLIQLSDLVHAHARELIHFHNKCERSQNSWFSVLKNLMGFHTPFEQLAEDSSALNAKWKQFRMDILVAEQKLQFSMTSAEKDYFHLISQYAQSNAAVAEILSERQIAFFEACKSAKRSRLTCDQTKQLADRYNSAVTHCQKMFEELRKKEFSLLLKNT